MDRVLKAADQLRALFQESTERFRFTDLRRSIGRAVEAFDPNSPAALTSAAALAYGAGRVDDGLALFELALEVENTPSLYSEHATLLVDAKAYAAARELAFDGLDRYPEDEALRVASDRAIDEDPVLLPPTPLLLTPSQADSIKALGGGSTVTFKLVVAGQNVAALKPDQDLGQSMYRSEIAFYRLCVLLRCSFRVPYNAPLEIEKGDFETLYSRVDSDKQSGYRSKFIHIKWHTGEDGATYLLATWKEWVPEFTGFPIEATSTWTSWVTAGSHSDLEEKVADWLPKLAEAAGPRGWTNNKARVGYAGEMTVRTLAQQISDVLSMDYLSNNWDRFSGDPELYGANCHMEPGGLVAIDNGAAFPPWDTSRVERRFKLTQRFSRRFVLALRRLDHDKTQERLFPGANTDELKRFEIFWGRRQSLLDRVDALIKEHGEDEILAF